MSTPNLFIIELTFLSICQYALHRINLPKYYSETAIPIKAYFFCIIAKSHHLLQSGFISNTAWSVPIVHYYLAC